MTLIKGGTVVTEAGEARLDVRILGRFIMEIGENLKPGVGEVTTDAAGKYVLPGLVDPHLHIHTDTGVFRTSDDWRTGSTAAALGGFTTLIDFATQAHGLSYERALDDRLAEIRENSAVDYSLHMMATDPAAAGSLAGLRARGVCSLKTYTTYRPNYYLDDAQLLALMRECAANGMVMMVHAESDAMVTEATRALVESGRRSWRHHAEARPELAEVEAAQRVLFLAAEARCPLYIVHNSSPRTVDEIAAAKARGQKVWSETCPQYLTLDDSVYRGDEAWRFILQPPLRSRAAVNGLWHHLGVGAVDALGTDHCDYTREQKTAVDDFTKTPGGLPGLEIALPLMYTAGVVERRISLSQLVQMMATNPARIFGLAPRKGAIAVDADADLVIFDPAPRWTVRAAGMTAMARYSPWEGLELQGRAVEVWRRGRRIVADGRFAGEFDGAWMPVPA